MGEKNLKKIYFRKLNYFHKRRLLGLVILAAGAVILFLAGGRNLVDYFQHGFFFHSFKPLHLIGLIAGALAAEGGIALVLGVKDKKIVFLLIGFSLTAYVLLSSWGIYNLFTGRASFRGAKDNIKRMLGMYKQPVGSSPFNFGQWARPTDHFYFFPYSFLQKNADHWGAGGGWHCKYLSNQLGFRLQEELSGFRVNHPNERVVLVLGGSAAFSSSVFDEGKTFSSVLEVLLNDDESLRNKQGHRFRVVNLGVRSAVILNEIVYYILFGKSLRPEIVIAHDGVNDLAYGQIGDPFLLEQYSITYSDKYETWAKMISTYGAFDFGMLPRPEREARPRIKNFEIIVDAYRQRLVQFQSIVQASGATFISGLQPFYKSKQNLSEEEEKNVTDCNPYYRHVFKNMSKIYELYVEHYGNDSSILNFINFHTEFKRFGPEATLFADVVHTTEDGDQVIAKMYHKKISEILSKAGCLD